MNPSISRRVSNMLRTTLTVAITIVALLSTKPILAAGAVISDAGTLRERVPNDAVAYLRVPGPWALLMAMEGRGLNNAVNDPAIQHALEQLRQAIGNELSTLDQQGAIAQLALTFLQSPIEAVVRMIHTEQQGPPSPAGLITAKVSFQTLEEVNAMINTIATTHPAIEYLTPLQPGAVGVLSLGGLPVAIHFEPSTQLVSIVAGATLAEPVIKDFLELPKTATRPIDTLEAEVDTSGQGLFLWINAQALMPYAQIFMPPEEVQIMQQWGLLETRAVAIGMGTAQRKGQTRVAIDIPRSGWLDLIPTATMTADLDAVGEIRWLAGLSILEADTVERIDTAIQYSGNTEALTEFRLWRQKIAELLGTNVFEEVAASIGPELIVFSDSTGDFGAVKIRDEQRYRALIIQLTKQPNVTLKQHDTTAGTINHLSILLPQYLPEDATQAAEPLNRWLNRANTMHFYWIEDGGYMVMASVPQVLIDRMNSKYRVSIAKWLTENEGSAYINSAALLSLRVDNLPRTIYHYMLQGIAVLSDLSGANIDLIALPSANQLRLPPDGALGWRIELSAERIAMQMTYDGTPFDIYGSNAFVTASLLGIIAAVAIPAYQDYTTRAHTQEAYAMVLDTVQTHHAIYGQFPAPGAKLDLPTVAATVISRAEVGTGGHILVELTGNDSIDGTVIRLQPQLGGDGIVGLKCVGSELKPKLRPALCR